MAGEHDAWSREVDAIAQLAAEVIGRDAELTPFADPVAAEIRKYAGLPSAARLEALLVQLEDAEMRCSTNASPVYARMRQALAERRSWAGEAAGKFDRHVVALERAAAQQTALTAGLRRLVRAHLALVDAVKEDLGALLAGVSEGLCQGSLDGLVIGREIAAVPVNPGEAVRPRELQKARTEGEVVVALLRGIVELREIAESAFDGVSAAFSQIAETVAEDIPHLDPSAAAAVTEAAFPRRA